MKRKCLHYEIAPCYKDGMAKQRHLIDRLGGSGYLAKKLRENQSTVSNWKRQGIPHRIKHKLSLLAETLNVRLPKRFWD